MSRAATAWIAVGISMMLAACSWHPVGIGEGDILLYFAVSEPALQPSTLDVRVGSYDSSSELNCIEAADDFAVSLNGRPGQVVSRGGLGGFRCAPAIARFELAAEELQAPAVLIASDSTAAITVDAWTDLPRRTGQLIEPANGHLAIGQAVRFDWPYPYQDYSFQITVGTRILEPVQVQDGHISATYQPEDARGEREAVTLSMRRILPVTCTGGRCNAEEFSSTTLPIDADTCDFNGHCEAH